MAVPVPEPVAHSPKRILRTSAKAVVVAAFAAGLSGYVPAFLQSSGKAQGASRRALLAAAVGSLGFGLPDASSGYMEKIRAAYPGIDKNDKTRCKWQSSAMGQANAARDKLFDLRQCKMKGTSAADLDVAGVLMNEGDFTEVDFTNTIMSKAIAQNATFDGANFKNAVADRVDFSGASFKGTIFKNTVLTGADFTNADLTNADFTDAYLEMYAIKPLCRNPTMKGTNPVTGADTYESAECFNQGLAR